MINLKSLTSTEIWSSALFILFIAIYLSTFAIQIQENEHLVNATNELNQTVQIAKLHYAREDSVPIKVFGKNNLHQLQIQDIIVLVVAALIYMFIIFNKRTFGEPIPEAVIKQAAKDMMEQRKDVKKATILEPCRLIAEQVDESTPRYKSWIVFCVVEFADILNELGGIKQLALEFDAYSGFKKDTFELTRFPTGFDIKCQNCGIFPDKKIITPEGWKQVLDRMGLKATGR